MGVSERWQLALPHIVMLAGAVASDTDWGRGANTTSALTRFPSQVLDPCEEPQDSGEQLNRRLATPPQSLFQTFPVLPRAVLSLPHAVLLGPGNLALGYCRFASYLPSVKPSLPVSSRASWELSAPLVLCSHAGCVYAQRI